jgi:hypothetical protein
VAGSCKYGDEPASYGTMDLVDASGTCKKCVEGFL